MSADECQFTHGAIFMTAMGSHECSLLFAPSSWVKDSHEWCSWSTLSTHEHPLAIMSTNKQPTEAVRDFDCQRALRSSHKHSWAICNEHPWELKSSHEYGAMRLWVLITTYERSWRHSTILRSTREYSWVNMRAHERLWELMSVMTGPEFWSAS